MIKHEYKRMSWQDAFSNLDVRPYAMITDPPYSARTHKGFGGELRSNQDNDCLKNITYTEITEQEIEVFVNAWASRVQRWFVLFCDHVSFYLWEREFQKAGLLTFAPVVWVKPNFSPRFLGDGPANGVEYICIARTREQLISSERGSRSPHYTGMGNRKNKRVGTKPLWLMRQLVREYSRPGDLIIDPFAGTGTTLIAAEGEGRKAIGSEIDSDAWKIYEDRLTTEGVQYDLYSSPKENFETNALSREEFPSE